MPSDSVKMPALVTLTSEADGSSQCVAESDIAIGAAALASTPLVAVLVESQQDERCSQCLQRLQADSTKCRKCQLERYCSQACRCERPRGHINAEHRIPGQTAAWTEYHSTLCGPLPSLHYVCRSNKLDEHQRHTVFLLAKLVALHFGANSGRNRETMLSLQDLDVRAIRRQHPEDPLGSESSDLSLLYTLLPAEIQDEDEIILDVVHGSLRTPLRELRLLLERFARNNHVLGDEMLKPFAHAIL